MDTKYIYELVNSKKFKYIKEKYIKSEDFHIDIYITNSKDVSCYMRKIGNHQYAFFINPTYVTEDIAEYCVFHEFFHCVQYEDNFPMIGRQREDKVCRTMQTFLASAVLDLNVNYLLYKENIILENSLLKGYEDIKNFYRLIDSHKKQIPETVMLQQSLSLSFFYMEDTQNIIEDYLKELNINHSDTVNAVRKMTEIIKAYDYNTQKGCENIFVNIMEEFHLERWIYVRSN